MKNIIGSIYVLHFKKPLKHAKHYIGWTSDIKSRIDRHREGRGSALMRAVKEAGIDFEIAAVYAGTRNDERKIKNQKNGPRFCNICKGT